MNSKDIKRLVALNQETDMWYQIWLSSYAFNQPKLHEMARQEVLKRIPELDRLGGCNHIYDGINDEEEEF